MVFAGDGRSDFCVSTQADLLFATGPLQLHCRGEEISFVPFTTFKDVLAVLGHVYDTRATATVDPAHGSAFAISI